MALTLTHADIADAKLIVIVNHDGSFHVKTELNGTEAAHLLYGVADQVNRV